MFWPSVVSCFSCASLTRPAGYRITTRMPETPRNACATALPVSPDVATMTVSCFARFRNEISHQARHEARAKILERQRRPVEQFENVQPFTERDERHGEIERLRHDLHQNVRRNFVAGEQRAYFLRNFVERERRQAFQEILVQVRNFDGHIQPAVGRRSAKDGVAQGNFRAAVESASVFHHAGRACPSSSSRKPRASELTFRQAFHRNDAVRVAFVKFLSVRDQLRIASRDRIVRGFAGALDKLIAPQDGLRVGQIPRDQEFLFRGRSLEVNHRGETLHSAADFLARVDDAARGVQNGPFLARRLNFIQRFVHGFYFALQIFFFTLAIGRLVRPTHPGRDPANAAVPARGKLGSKFFLDPVVNADDAKSGASQLLRPVRLSGAGHSDKR